MTLKSDVKFDEKLTLDSKNDNHSKVHKFHIDGLFLFKVYEVWAKKYRGVIFNDTEQWCKVLIKPELVVSKMT